MLCVLVLFREFVMAIWPLIPLHPNPAPDHPKFGQPHNVHEGKMTNISNSDRVSYLNGYFLTIIFKQDMEEEKMKRIAILIAIFALAA